MCLACGRGGEGPICRCGPGSVRPPGGPKGFLAVGFTGRGHAMAGSGSPKGPFGEVDLPAGRV